MQIKAQKPLSTIQEIETAFHLKLTITTKQVNWQQRNTVQLNKNKEIIGLNINGNKLNTIPLLNIPSLQTLFLASNQITTIQNLEKLTSLQTLFLASNQITTIQNLEKLTSLQTLFLHSNQITTIQNLEKLTSLQNLYLASNQITTIQNLEKLTSLQNLTLYDNQITTIQNLEKLTSLQTLDLAFNQITTIQNLEKLTSLQTLDLASNQITTIQNLEKLTSLQTLYLASNQITTIQNLEKLTSLQTLYLASNQITTIQNLEKLTSLQTLFLASNQITTIQNLEKLTSLQTLDLQYNKITDISSLKGIISRLKKINVTDNPIQGVPLSNFDNIEALKGYFATIEDEDILIDNIWLKVNILGSGNIGKTQLFNFLNKKPYEPKHIATHGTQHAFYTLPTKTSSEDKHISFWDFGGQDYYHSTHHLFLRKRDFNIVLSRSEGDEQGYGYWLGAARHFSDRDTGNQYINPLWLVQNQWYNEPLITPESNKLKNYQIGPTEFFSINVRELHQSNSDTPLKDELTPEQQDIVCKKGQEWKIWNSYFIKSLHYKIAQYAKQSYGKIPQNFHKIAQTLSNYKAGEKKLIYKKKEEFLSEIANDIKSTKHEFLLEVLELAGLILYFQDHEKLKNYVFLKPWLLSEWLHENFIEEGINEGNGVLQLQKVEVTEEEKKIFLNLMESFGLIFKNQRDDLLFPQYLPLRNDSFKEALLQVIPFHFSLIYEDFIHLSRLFQFISTYAKYTFGKTENNTAYWRYGILFEKKEVQAMVYFDKESKSISVHLKAENKNNKIAIAREILEFFIYEPKKKEENEKSEASKQNISHQVDPVENKATQQNITKKVRLPHAIYLQRGNLYTIDIAETIQTNKGNQQAKGKCVTKNQWVSLDYFTTKTLNLDKGLLKQVFISYSKSDNTLKEELKVHLSPFVKNGFISIYDDSNLRTGDWNIQLKTQIEQCDIMICLLSPNFLATDYIMEDELPLANHLNKKIAYIVLRPCGWEYAQINLKSGDKKDIKKDNILLKAQPITYNTENDKELGIYARDANWKKAIDELEIEFNKSY